MNNATAAVLKQLENADEDLLSYAHTEEQYNLHYTRSGYTHWGACAAQSAAKYVLGDSLACDGELPVAEMIDWPEVAGWFDDHYPLIA